MEEPDAENTRTDKDTNVAIRIFSKLLGSPPTHNTSQWG